MSEKFTIKTATVDDVTVIFNFIKELADFEKLAHEVVATEELLKKNLFGEKAYAHVILGFENNIPVAFALYFHNFSTFLAKPGIYLEDLFVSPTVRGKGYGKKMLNYLAKQCEEKDCGRLEWWVLNWNEKAIRFYESLDAKPMDEWTVFRLNGDALISLAKN